MAEPTTNQVAFDTPDAQVKIARACIGHVIELGEAKTTRPKPGEAEGRYIQQPYVIKALAAGMDANGSLFYRPEFLQPGAVRGFKAIDDEKLRRSLEFTYMTHICGSGDLSTLAGLCGTPERYAELSRRLAALANPDENAVRDVLRAYLLDEGQGVPVGYVMTQRKDDTGEVDEHGRKIKRLSPYMEIGRWFYPGDEKAIKRLQRTAEQGKLQITFEV